MKNIFYILLFLACFGGMTACSEDDIVPNADLGQPEYNLPKGEPGSVDEMIWQIHEKYGSYILYSFEEKDLTRVWTSSWSKWYAPANLSNDKAYVRKMVEALQTSVFNKFEEKFIRDNFPYKVLLVDSLCDRYEYSKSKLVNLLSNGQNAIAISNVGVAMDSWGEKEWNSFSVELNNAFTLFYYSALPKKPLEFIASRWTKITFPILKDPEGIDDNYNYSCWNVGYIAGSMGSTYMRPSEDLDFADFVAFLTGTPGSEIIRRFNRFPVLKDRALLLYPYLVNDVKMDVVATQNGNCPEDKLPAGFFESLE